MKRWLPWIVIALVAALLLWVFSMTWIGQVVLAILYIIFTGGEGLK